MPRLTHLTLYRIALGLFIFGLVMSGLTAFPLEWELSLLTGFLGITDPAAYATMPEGLHRWIAYVYHGLRETYAAYPFMAYGTDWLAYGHLTIALFFIGPWLRPVQNKWVLWVGLVACAGIIPLALICGALRDIPFYWQLIDCSFGVFGALPLLFCLHLTRRLEAS